MLHTVRHWDGAPDLLTPFGCAATLRYTTTHDATRRRRNQS